MTSISDRDGYKIICKNASINSDDFKCFKTKNEYKSILEHVSYEDGLKYLDIITTTFDEYINYISLFKKNDLYGGSVKYSYDKIGEISPSTLRYIKVLSDIKTIFGDLNNKNIIEIGVGYGGQCFILNQFYKIKNYYLIDLPEVQELSNVYLNKLGVNSHKILDVSKLTEYNIDYDIVISNYAYSELDINLQNYYYDNIIKKSKMGYFTFNFISELYGINSYKKQEIIEKFKNKNLVIKEEQPLTFNNNCVIFYK